MKRLLVAMILTGCSGQQIVDGVPVDQNGWPVREASMRYECPPQASLLDVRMPDGSRSVSCVTPGNPIPRRFKIVWLPDGTLDQRFELTDSGAPIRRDRFHSSGALRSREVYKDGQLESREAWFESGEEREKRTRQVDGNMRITRWQPDGTIESDGEYRGDVKVGSWKEWRDGALEEATYVGGVREGRVQRTYVDRSVELGTMKAGRREGTWSRVDASGARMLVMEYERGELNGRWVSFHPNQSLAIEGRYVAGKRHGVFVTYYPTGLRKTETRYRCDLEDGPSKAWYPSGKVSEAGEWRGGKKVGIWKAFTEGGDVRQVDNFPTAGESPACAIP